MTAQVPPFNAVPKTDGTLDPIELSGGIRDFAVKYLLSTDPLVMADTKNTKRST